MKTEDTSPRYDRRKALREDEEGRSSTTVSNSFPIETYYKAVDKLGTAFQISLDDRRLDHAYVLGIRFATFSIEHLPLHTSYRLKQHTAARVRNARQLDEVLKKVQSVTERMDAEEAAKQQHQQQQQQQQRDREEEETNKKEQQKEREYQEQKQRRQVEEEITKNQQEEKKRQMKEKRKLSRQQVEQSALAKLNAMMQKGGKSMPETVQGEGKTQQKRANISSRDSTKLAKASKDLNNAAPDETNAAIMKGRQERLANEAGGCLLQQQEQGALTRDKNQNQIILPKTSMEEQRTIQLLQDTIAQQEERIENIMEGKVPALLEDAKAKKFAGHRKDALYCIYHKRKWVQSVNVLKEHIFKMETQILRLESAAEDREVAAVMKAATDTMKTLQSEGTVDDIHHVLGKFAKEGVMEGNDIFFDEDDLLRELEEESTSTTATSTLGKEISLLAESQGFGIVSLPTVPITRIVPELKKKPSSLLKVNIA